MNSILISLKNTFISRETTKERVKDSVFKAVPSKESSFLKDISL